MSARKSFTLAESVMKPCTEIAAREVNGGTIGYDLSAKTAIVRYHGGKRAVAPKFSKTCLVLGTTTSYNHSPWKYQLVAALCAVMAGSLKETFLANLRDAPCFEIQFDEKTDLTSDSRYIGKLNWFHMFAFLTRNAWKSSIIRPICFIFLLAWTPLQPVSLQNWPITFQNTVRRGWNAKLWTHTVHGRHSTWRCCAHEASRVRNCKYPCVIIREALEDKKLGNEEEHCQLADVIFDISKIVNAMLNRNKVVSLMNLS